MKHDFTATAHPLTAARKLFVSWLLSTRGIPLKVSAFGAVTCVVASIGVGMAVGQPQEDGLLLAEQAKSCRAITGKTDAEIAQTHPKCEVSHPGLFGP